MTVLARKHYPSDASVWKLLFQHLVQFIVANEHNQTPLLSAVCPAEERDAFFKAFAVVMAKAKEFKFDFKYLNSHLYLLIRNHLRFQNRHGPEVANKWENAKGSGDLAASFLAYSGYALQHWGDYFNEYDEEVKKKHVREWLHEGQRVLGKVSDKTRSLLESCLSPENLLK